MPRNLLQVPNEITQYSNSFFKFKQIQTISSFSQLSTESMGNIESAIQIITQILPKYPSQQYLEILRSENEGPLIHSQKQRKTIVELLKDAQHTLCIQVMAQLKQKKVEEAQQQMDKMPENCSRCLCIVYGMLKTQPEAELNLMKILTWIYALVQIQPKIENEDCQLVIARSKDKLILLGFELLRAAGVNIETRPNTPTASKNRLLRIQFSNLVTPQQQNKQNQIKLSSSSIKLICKPQHDQADFCDAMRTFIKNKQAKVFSLRYEICRICENYILVHNMYQHLAQCQFIHQKSYFEAKLLQKGQQILTILKEEGEEIGIFFERIYTPLGETRVTFDLKDDLNEIKEIIEQFKSHQNIHVAAIVELLGSYSQVLALKCTRGYQSDDEGKQHEKSKMSISSKKTISLSKRSIGMPIINSRKPISSAMITSELIIESENTINSESRKTRTSNTEFRLEGTYCTSLDFQILQQIGKGSYSEVFLVRRKNTKDLYAMKVIEFTDFQDSTLQTFKKEQRVYRSLSGGHTVKLYYSFAEDNLYFLVLDYAPGGSLADLLEREVYLSETDAKLYIANILLAIDSLHRQGIVHSDLKPENIVIDQSGFLVLTDFNLSKLIGYPQHNQQGTFFGSPDYIAPQVIQSKQSNHMRDYFSVGVIAYQMMMGTRPFADDTPQAVFENILKGKIEWPEIGDGEDGISQNALDFLSILMHPNPRWRLGANGLSEIKKHPFFSDFNWNNWHHHKPYFVPSNRHIPQTQNFQLQSRIQSKRLRLIQSLPTKLDTIVRYDILKSKTSRNARSQRHSIVKLQKQLQLFNSLKNSNNNKKPVSHNLIDSTTILKELQNV